MTDQKKQNDSMEQSLKNLYTWAAANNVIIETIQKDSEEDFKRRQKNMTNARTNETSKLANEYRLLAMDFKSRNKAVIENFKQQPDQASSIESFELALKTIAFYEVQLPVKITQAYVGISEFVETTTDPVQNDFNANAKIVLASIEHSFSAWEKVNTCIPGCEKFCMQALLLLDRINKRMLADFPNAEAFIIPASTSLNKPDWLSQN